jgi:hypothetical protein
MRLRSAGLEAGGSSTAGGAGQRVRYGPVQIDGDAGVSPAGSLLSKGVLSISCSSNVAAFPTGGGEASSIGSSRITRVGDEEGRGTRRSRVLSERRVIRVGPGA